MSSSTHQIKVKANDQTAGAFASIQKRAQAAGINIRKMLGSAIAGASAYLGMRQIVSGVDELGRLSDTAMRASTSVDELTSASTAMGILGLKVDIDQLTDAFMRMAKNTGRTGLGGFYETISEIGKIEDVSKRSEAAMKVFGRAGLEFMPLINAANDGTTALQNVIDAMPKVSQAAANAGDKLSDAKTIGVAGFKSLWFEAIRSVANNIDSQFTGGIRKAALDGVAWFGYYAKAGWTNLVTFFSAISLAIQGLISQNKSLAESFLDISKGAAATLGGKTWSGVRQFANWSGISEFIFGHKLSTKSKYTDAFSNAIERTLDPIDFDAIGSLLNANEQTLAALRKELESQLSRNKAGAESIDKAVKSTDQRQAEDAAAAATSKQPNIRNALVLGGSNSALRLSVLSPQTQELKKQTDILKKIEQNTKQTSSNTKSTSTEQYEVWNG